MARFLHNASTILSNPRMMLAYLRWVGSCTVRRRPPSISAGLGHGVSDWISFSEYWGFFPGLPEAELNFIRTSLGKSKRAVDIGANVGLFSLALAVAGFQEVHAFEPVPTTYARLRKNLEDSASKDRFRLHQLAMGDTEGELEFQVSAYSPATNRIATGPVAAGQTQSVRVTTLDSFCEQNGIDQIDFLKVDVEGMEPRVIRGAKNMLRSGRVSRFLIELCPPNLTSVGCSVRELWESIAEADCALHKVTEAGGIGAAYTEAEVEGIRLANAAVVPGAVRK